MTQKEGAILIIDDDTDILIAARLLLKRYFSTVITCQHPEYVPEIMGETRFDAILLDMNFGPGESCGQQGYLWLEKILDIDHNAVVIMITAHGGVDIAVKAMKLGASDFITKPWQNEKVIATLSSAVELGRSRNETNILKNTNKVLAQVTSTSGTKPILGNSEPMQKVMRLIERIAPTDANVLILGENGTGKELVARALHMHSKRTDQVFMSVDLGAISENLFESELFGHKKGAFTDARDDRTGRLQAANGGTLFLDEIGNLPLHLQTKLLTVLEQRQVTPLGANQAIDINVRVITATNVPKSELIKNEHFRQDLLFRLNTVEITLPPLRERIEDITAIVHYYVDIYSKKYNKLTKELSDSALSAINAYPWPGNVRELKHAIERAVILSDGLKFEALDFHLDPLVSKNFVLDHRKTQTSDEVDDDLNLERIEKIAITHSLRKHRYNITYTAKELGLTRAALYRRMEKHNL